MKLNEKYARDSDDIKEKVDKIIISNEAYAICDFIERVLNKLEQIRRQA